MIRLLRRPREWWLRRTLRFRVTLVATGVAVLSLLALARLTEGLVGTLLVDAADSELRGVLATATSAVTAGRAPAPPRTGVELRVLDSAGDPLDGRPPPRLSAPDIRHLKAGEGVLYLGEDPPRRWVAEVVSAPDGTQRLIAAGADLIGYVVTLQRSTRWLVGAALLGGLAVGVATWFVVSWSLYPVERMRAAAGALPPGRRLPVPAAKDELRALAEALNNLLARRDDATERLRRFTGDAAHELRSPIASIRAQTEVAVAHPDPEFSQEVLKAVVEESQRMSTLVDHLLVLARSDAGELPPAEPVDLVVAAEAAVGRLPPGPPRVVLDAPTSTAWALASRGDATLVLDNLLRNAVRHARALVRVAVLPAGRQVRLVVDDDGPGVPAEHRTRVFDRFYRVQDDRGRATGGFGLGLALVAEVVRRRRGTVRVGDSPEGGARFEVRWRAAC
ncbi:sensor histidine kinase [Gandjariella thermophila]|uniref:histidine kinase n=1 Tax=Gandjariella thermophila TaxID=1931992 RepID=A0A4D4J624_9PSEU|nr:ATP-binding protein [Gandjariella thermophila]GDY29956.1 two-component sensor histidine kinase [Gandjariella thermophila]